MGEGARRQAKNEEDDQENHSQESGAVVGMEKRKPRMHRFVESQRRTIFEHDGRSQWWEPCRREGSKDITKFDRNGEFGEATINHRCPYHHQVMPQFVSDSMRLRPILP